MESLVAVLGALVLLTGLYLGLAALYWLRRARQYQEDFGALYQIVGPYLPDRAVDSAILNWLVDASEGREPCRMMDFLPYEHQIVDDKDKSS